MSMDLQITAYRALTAVAERAAPLTPEATEVVISRADYLRLMAVRDDIASVCGIRQHPHVLAMIPDPRARYDTGATRAAGDLK